MSLMAAKCDWNHPTYAPSKQTPGYCDFNLIPVGRVCVNNWFCLHSSLITAFHLTHICPRGAKTIKALNEVNINWSIILRTKERPVCIFTVGPTVKPFLLRLDITCMNWASSSRIWTLSLAFSLLSSTGHTILPAHEPLLWSPCLISLLI